MKFKPFPQLKTERLVLRELLKSDWKRVSYLRTDPIVNQFVKRPNADTKEKAIDFIERTKLGIKNSETIHWTISLKNNFGMIGSICLWNFSEDRKTAEIGYDLDPIFHNTGIMNEAMTAVLKFGFNVLGFNKIEAFTQKNNEASTKLLRNNEFFLNKDRFDEGNPKNIIFEKFNPSLGSNSPTQ